MGKKIEVRGVTLGEGRPKICTPLMGKDKSLLIEEVQLLKTMAVDIVEWRMDYFEQVENIKVVREVLKTLREALGDMPLLATFRTKEEGGERKITKSYYSHLNKEVIASGDIDLIDVELFMGNEEVSTLIREAHDHDVKVVLSNHDFTKTPSKEEMIARLCKMQEMGGDLPKIAVMPHHVGDVLTLLAATNEMVEKYAQTPIITMSMGELGQISRMAGEVFGSAVTFGAVKAVSAPGQMTITQLETVLNIIHGAK